MKIAVYTIAKNEKQFIERWAKSCEDADLRLVLDTGSTDGSEEEWNHVQSHAENPVFIVNKKIVPWRFDVARNRVLDLLPEEIDICIALDMDEILLPGWRQALEDFMESNQPVTRPRYKYVWSWNEDGTEGLVYGGDKIHLRHGYRWKHPVHEVVSPLIPEVQGWVEGLEIHHHPDHTKSRSQYFDLLKLAVEEEPKDDRNQFYLAREYFFHNEKSLAKGHFLEHLELSCWSPERAASCRYLAKCDPEKEEHWLWRAVAEDPSRRENWVALAEYHYANTRDWVAVKAACDMAFRVTEKPLDYLCEAGAWGWLPYDLAAIACYHLGDTDLAWYYGAEAVALNPDDERLQANLRWYHS